MEFLLVSLTYVEFKLWSSVVWHRVVVQFVTQISEELSALMFLSGG